MSRPLKFHVKKNQQKYALRFWCANNLLLTEVNWGMFWGSILNVYFTRESHEVIVLMTNNLRVFFYLNKKIQKLELRDYWKMQQAFLFHTKKKRPQIVVSVQIVIKTLILYFNLKMFISNPGSNAELTSIIFKWFWDQKVWSLVLFFVFLIFLRVLFY